MHCATRSFSAFCFARNKSICCNYFLTVYGKIRNKFFFLGRGSKKDYWQGILRNNMHNNIHDKNKIHIKYNAFVTLSWVILSPTGISLICVYLIPIPEAFNNSAEEKNCESFSINMFCMCVIFLVNIAIVVSSYTVD